MAERSKYQQTHLLGLLIRTDGRTACIARSFTVDCHEVRLACYADSVSGPQPESLTNASRCGAKTRSGQPCRAPAMPNGRCRMHGGKSTGPRTPEGLARARRGNWKHGRYSREAIADRRRLRAQFRLLHQAGQLIGQLFEEIHKPEPDPVRALATQFLLEMLEDEYAELREAKPAD